VAIKCPKCQFKNPDTAKFCSECATPLQPSKDVSVTKTLKKSAKGFKKDTVIAKKYKIIEKLGEGGMGVVYRAKDTRLDRTVALKFLPSELTKDEEARKRFIQEAKAAAALNHPQICTIYEINEADNQTFISMEFIEGQTLKEKIETKPLGVDEAVDIASQVAEGLGEAHKKGIIHRDIKPANIMLTDKGQAKITDFGLAKLSWGVELTKPATIMGTVAYMSSEQARGERVDHRTDIWSLGVVLYQCLSGQLPFKGEHDQVMLHSILNEEPQPLMDLCADIPKALEQIVNQALTKIVDDRYQDVKEMLKELQSVKKEIETGISAESPSLFKDLLRRRVPQILGIYLAAVLVIGQFVKWLGNRFLISPHLSDFILVALLSIIPSVSILAFFHGRWGRAKKAGIKKISFTINLLVSACLLFFIFHGKDLGAATKAITVTDEEGQMIKRVIPKSEFRKKVALFFFENESGDPSLDWLQYGITFLLNADLLQDLFLDITPEFTFFDKMEEAGFPEGIGLPLTLRNKLAKGLHRNYFVSGSFIRQEGEFLLKTSIYETERARLIKEGSFAGEDLFKLIDEMSVQIKHDLHIPEHHIEEVKDLPISEMTTNSIRALELYMKGVRAILFEQAWDDRFKYLEQSVEEDPAFAYVYQEMQILYGFSNQRKKREQAFQSLLEHLYKLPERMQYLCKSDYYFFKEDPEKQLAVVKMMVDISPEDITGRRALALLYTYRDQKEKALLEYERILELDPEQYDILLSIGAHHKQKGEFREALKYYEQYAEQFPDDLKSFTVVGDLYRTIGDYEQAKSYYEKALLIEPEKFSVLLTLAEIESTLGNFQDAEKMYHHVLKISKTSQDKMSACNALAAFYGIKGQACKSLEYVDLFLTESAKVKTPFFVMLNRIEFLESYIEVGKEQIAIDAVKEFEAQAKPPYDKLVPLAYLALYVELEDVEKAEKEIEGVEIFIQTFQFETFRPVVFEAKGNIDELKGDYEQAILNYQKVLELTPTSTEIDKEIGRCYGKLEKFKDAEEHLQKALKKFPFDPEVHYEMAVVYWDWGKKHRALEHLEIALDVWKEADPEYKPALKAREKFEDWK
jgi:serine/threonine protein kinase/tetratricopeptide (TPR) repeat protein